MVLNQDFTPATSVIALTKHLAAEMNLSILLQLTLIACTSNLDMHYYYLHSSTHPADVKNSILTLNSNRRGRGSKIICMKLRRLIVGFLIGTPNLGNGFPYPKSNNFFYLRKAPSAGSSSNTLKISLKKSV